ncbi:formate dehydrogenase accessory protein FdhE [Ancylobacter mangrovi]|uniref:formate dehydrogenase accessory protein FdhE n=1 Tax=Ancylobacter mangrovi TaxID=2972472 RepID=UPI00216364BF|nr:formate dehydrogenase accessory protein FdhE [Ancylobacter mangrovi]MCS0504970.1 formate dehydrogenase accessory protein FdhE [Ancylobacter mangrovi]
MSVIPQPDPSVIGTVSTPPFAVLPDPASVFTARAARLGTYAEVSPLKPYLSFVAGLVDAQHAILAGLPPVEMPDAEMLARAASHQMPPLDRTGTTLDDTLETTLDALFDAATQVAMPDEAGEALARVSAADGAQRAQMVRDVLAHAMPVEMLAEHIYVAAALQVHFTRLAAALDAPSLQPVGDGVCPACGGPPVASLIVEWPNAHGNRFCACSLCSTLWHYVRIRCCSCGTTKGIGYQEIEQSPGTIKAETCDECRTYVKVMYQNKDPAIEPMADDIGTLALDLMMREGPYRRAAFNPFLLGY